MDLYELGCFTFFNLIMLERSSTRRLENFEHFGIERKNAVSGLIMIYKVKPFDSNLPKRMKSIKDKPMKRNRSSSNMKRGKS